MKVHFNEKPCVVKQSKNIKDVTPAKLDQLRTSVMKAEKNICELRQMATNLQNMNDYNY